ncbi:MAG: hypothetical protein QG670_1037 [Thermoproteota archaeon]|nr:hypothetical protein [Thermoproteota archaeon]
MRHNKEAMDKVEEAMKSPGVKLIEGYLDGPNHVFYFVVERMTTLLLITLWNHLG